TLAVRWSLAWWTGMAGDAAEARDQYTALLPVFERVCGPEHLDTLAIRGGVARRTGAAGEAAGARDQYVTLLPVRERGAGTGHPATLAVRRNLAPWTGKAGNAALISGPEHPRTLAGVWRHPTAGSEQVRSATLARDQYAALLPVYERVCGPEHLDTLAVR